MTIISITYATLNSYCESDVIGLERLMLRMWPILDWRRAALRGSYISASAKIESNGIPIDSVALQILRENREPLRQRLIRSTDTVRRIYDDEGVWRMDHWEQWLREHRIDWPRLTTGRLKMDSDTFSDMEFVHPAIKSIKEVRSILSKMRFDLPVGRDGRNRSHLFPFGTITGRNAPSSAQFVFGLPSSMRPLICPPVGRALAYLDWSQQEYAIAGKLSGDLAMIGCYESGDPYVDMAKRCGFIPSGGTAETHPQIREQFKKLVLATQYGMGPTSFAVQIGSTIAHARQLLQAHRELFRQFWQWSDGNVAHVMLYNEIQTVFGWTLHINGPIKEPTLRNWPMQANGSEMLRLACIMATERGVQIDASVHDAILLEAATEDLESHISIARQAMADASAAVLDGFRLRVDVRRFVYPNRFFDKKGKPMWDTIWRILGESCQAATPYLCS